jgi:energy-coupling factor transporter ATP-binding protein EcfA2
LNSASVICPKLATLTVSINSSKIQSESSFLHEDLDANRFMGSAMPIYCMTTILTQIQISNAWGHLDYQERFLEDEEAQKLCVLESAAFSPSHRFSIPVPLEQSDLPSELFVNVLYGSNGSGKTTSLKLMNGALELIEGLIEQVKQQEKTLFSTKSAREWALGKIPPNTAEKEDSTRLKSRSYADNEFVQNLLLSFNQIYERFENSDAISGFYRSWDKHVSPRDSEFQFKISGFHTNNEGVLYDFKLEFTRLNRDLYAHGEEGLHFPGRISNLGHAGFVVKCDLNETTHTYDFALSESPDGPAYSQKRVLQKDEGDQYYQEFEKSSCIPFVINEDLEVIPLGSLWFDWRDAIDEQLSIRMSSKIKRDELLDHLELEALRESSSEYFFLYPIKIDDEMKFYFEDMLTSHFEGFESYNDDGLIMTKLSAFITISSELESDYVFTPDINPMPIKASTYRCKGRIKTSDVKNTQWYLPLLNQIVNIEKDALELLLENMAYKEKLENDENHAIKVELLNKLNTKELQSVMTGLNKYTDSNYGFINFKIRMPNKESSKPRELSSDELLDRIDDIRNRLEFLWSEGISRLNYLRQYDDMVSVLEKFTGLIMAENPRTFSNLIFSKTRLRKKNASGQINRVKYEHLSSGERSIFNLIYQLSTTKRKGPIFIDEPEISLHPIWQLEFKELVLKLIKHSRRQVFFSSHSPDIVIPFENRSFPVERSVGGEV